MKDNVRVWDLDRSRVSVWHVTCRKGVGVVRAVRVGYHTKSMVNKVLSNVTSDL